MHHTWLYPLPLSPLSFIWPCEGLSAVGGKGLLSSLKLNLTSLFSSVSWALNWNLLSLSSQMYMGFLHRKHISSELTAFDRSLILCLAFYFHFSPTSILQFQLWFSLSFFKKFYLFERESAQVEGKTERGRRKTCSLLSREPNMGLNPRTPGSWADADA